MDDGFGIELLCAVVAGRLTPLQREVFIDVELLGRRSVDVAADLGLTRQAVNALGNRARERIAAAIGERVAA